MDRQLRKAIEVKFGKPISKQVDVQDLKDDILFETSQILGYNTLRRAFGFLNSVQASRKTLQILSNYVGYRSYNHFLKRDTENRLGADWIELQMWMVKKTIDHETFSFLEKYRDKDYFHLFVSHIIKSLIDQGNWAHLSNLFENTRLFDNHHRTVIPRIATSLHFSLMNLPKRKIHKISDLLKNKNFRNLSLYAWVDYDEANGYFGDLVRRSEEHLETEDEILFTKLYMAKIDFLNQSDFEIDFNAITVFKNCHSILHGRYLSMQLVCLPKQRKKIKSQILSVARRVKNKNELFQEIIPILMLLRDVDFMEEIFNLYYDELIGYMHWDHVSIERYNIIALIIVNLNNGLLKNNKLLFEFFDKEKVFHNNDKYHKIFYLVASYHHERLSNNDADFKQIKSEYKSLVKELKFPFFSQSFLENYFEKT